MDTRIEFNFHVREIIKLIKENNLTTAKEIFDTKLNPLLNSLDSVKDSNFYDIQEMLSDLINEIPSVELRDVEEECTRLEKEKGCTF